MKEKDVVKAVVSYLEAQGYYVQEQFETGRGKVDVAGFKWLDDYEIDSVGVECKPTRNPKAIMKWLREQIFNYQKYFPKVYLAIPEGGDVQTLTSLCKVSFVGYMVAEGSGKVKVELEAPNISPTFDDSSYCLEVLSKVLIWLTFREVFGNDVLSSTRGWISTKGNVQFNLFEYRSSVSLSVNIEDARKVLTKVDKHYLHDALKKAPDDALLWLAKENYFGPGFRVAQTLLWKWLKDTTLEDADFIINAIKRGGANFHFQVSKDVWSRDEILGRKTHLNRIRKAKDELSHLYNLLAKL